MIGGTGQNLLNGGDGIDTVDYSQATKGIVARLDRGVALAPIYGALKQPKIMPLGDSIAEGGHSIEPTPGAYRIQLWKNFSADGLSIDFVGSQSNGPSELGDKDHEGHGGWTIEQITALVDKGLLKTYRPDIVLLEIGTNNLGSNSLTEMTSKLDYLIDRIAAQSPRTQILISSITPIDPNGSRHVSQKSADKAKDFDALLPDFVADKAAQGKKVTFVDVGGSLTIEDLGSDGVHPSPEGYKKLGNAWYDALVERDTLKSIEHIVGTRYQDKLIGNAGTNVLEGGAGKDLLAGGGGADTFVYRSPQHGKDTITDFSEVDFLQISAAGFGGGLIAGTPLSLTEATTGVFVSGTSPLPLGNSANFLYDTATGLLSFDSDGIGVNSAVTLARFSGLPNLNSNQISIVA